MASKYNHLYTIAAKIRDLYDGYSKRFRAHASKFESNNNDKPHF